MDMSRSRRVGRPVLAGASGRSSGLSRFWSGCLAAGCSIPRDGPGPGAERVEVHPRRQRGCRAPAAERGATRRGIASGPRRSTSISGSSSVTARRSPSCRKASRARTRPTSSSCTWTAGSIAIAGSPRCRPRRGRSIAIGSTRWPSAGIGRGPSRRDPRPAPPRRGPGVLQLLGGRRPRAARRPRVPGRAIRRGARGLQPARRRPARRSVRPGPSRSLGGSGAGGGQEDAVPVGRGAAAEPRRPGRVRPAISGGDGHASPVGRGGYASILAEAIAGDQLEIAGPAGRPMADLRRLAATDPGRARADRRRAGAMAGRAREGLHRPATDRPAGCAACRAVPPRPESLLAFHPIVLGDQVLVCDGSKVLAYNLSDRPGRRGGRRGRGR